MLTISNSSTFVPPKPGSTDTELSVVAANENPLSTALTFPIKGAVTRRDLITGAASNGLAQPKLEAVEAVKSASHFIGLAYVSKPGALDKIPATCDTAKAVDSKGHFPALVSSLSDRDPIWGFAAPINLTSSK